MQVNLSEDELSLIEAIRNLRRAYPNGYENLLYYAQELFDELVDEYAIRNSSGDKSTCDD